MIAAAMAGHPLERSQNLDFQKLTEISRPGRSNKAKKLCASLQKSIDLKCTVLYQAASTALMSSSSKQLEGLYWHKMDAAGRVAIPAELDLRPADGERLRFLSTSRRGCPVLALITQSEMDRRLADIDSLKEPGTDRDAPPLIKREMKVRLHSKCRPALINTQGKLQVPKDLATAAGLAAGGEVVLVGCGQYVEIWNAANYAKADVNTEAALALYNADAGVF